MNKILSLVAVAALLQTCNALLPIILVPGYTDSRLVAELNRTSAEHPWCPKKTATPFTIWLEPQRLLRFQIYCFIDNMKLRYDNVTRRTYDAEGVHISVPGFGDTHTIEYPNPQAVQIKYGYYAKMVETFTMHGYVRNKTIRGAPYDFRRAANEQDEYFARLKMLVEETYTINNNKKVVLVGHSMGCDMLIEFLSAKVDQKWKDTYLKAFVSLSGPYGGSVKSLVSFITGGNFKSGLINSTAIREFERSETSMVSFLPSATTWKGDQVLVSTNERNYTVNDYIQLFQDLNYTNGKDMYYDTKDLIKNDTVPGVEAHCLHGTRIPTVERLIYSSGFENTPPTKIIYGDGDGTVNRRSLEACKKWSQHQKQKVHYMRFPGVEHSQLIKTPSVISYIVQIAAEE